MTSQSSPHFAEALSDPEIKSSVDRFLQNVDAKLRAEPP